MHWLCSKQCLGETPNIPRVLVLSSHMLAAEAAEGGRGLAFCSVARWTLSSGWWAPAGGLVPGCLCTFSLQPGLGEQGRGGSGRVVLAASPAAAAAAWLPSFAWRCPCACETCGARAWGTWSAPSVRTAFCSALFLPGGRFGLPSQLLWRVPSHKGDVLELFF